MRHQTHEIALAYELIVQATDRLEPLMNPEDLEAGIVASLATALEIASHRQLKELNEIYQTKSIWLESKEFYSVHSIWESNHAAVCCDTKLRTQGNENLFKGRSKMIFNAVEEFPKAGLTPDEHGEYKMGLSEMARFSAYQQQKEQDREFERWMTDDE